MTDLANLIRYMRRNGIGSDITDDDIQAAYNDYYFCGCESCLYEKENGHIPFRLHDKCKLPIQSAITMDYIKSHKTQETTGGQVT